MRNHPFQLCYALLVRPDACVQSLHALLVAILRLFQLSELATELLNSDEGLLDRLHLALELPDSLCVLFPPESKLGHLLRLDALREDNSHLPWSSTGAVRG